MYLLFVSLHMSDARLGGDEGQAVGREDLVDGLEVGSSSSALAVAAAARGDALRLGAGEPRATRVAVVSAGIGLGEAGDGTVGAVVDGSVLALDGAAVDAGGLAGAADGGANGGLGVALDGVVGLAVAVDGAGEGGAGVGLDVAHVGITGEGGLSKLAEGGAGGGLDVGALGTAVAGRHEAAVDGEADGADELVVDVVGVAAADVVADRGHLGDGLDRVLGGGEASLLGEVGGLRVAGVLEGLEDELVGSLVNVEGGDGVGGSALVGAAEGAVESGLGLLQLGQRRSHHDGRGALGGDLVGGSLVGDANHGLARVDPGAGERRTRGAAKLLDEGGCLDVVGDAGGGLLGVEAKVTLHGLQDVGVQGVGRRGRGTVDDGQHGREEGKSLDELHDVCVCVKSVKKRV